MARLEMRRFRWPDGKRYLSIRIGQWEWDFGNWALRDDKHQYFALRCEACRRWSWGCKDHWFCGLCKHCEEA